MTDERLLLFYLIWLRHKQPLQAAILTLLCNQRLQSFECNIVSILIIPQTFFHPLKLAFLESIVVIVSTK